MARTSSRRTRRAVLGGVLGVAVGIGLFVGVAVYAGRGNADVRLGDDEFGPLRTDSLAAVIERDGPVFFPDASPNRARDIYLQHLGDEEDVGWLAFAAQPPGAARTCQLQWVAEDRELLDPCSGDRYPEDGEGLPRYRVRIEENRLYVRLN